jgi:hypothetical protein
LKGTTEKRCLDWTPREHSDWLFGRVEGQTKWVTAAEVDDEHLKQNWIEDDTEKSGPKGETHLFSHVVSLDNDWVADQIWGFQMINGERRYARNIVVSKDGQRACIRLVYDFVP